MIVGTTLGPYRVLEKLGEGGMGEVYRAKDSRLGRDVAIKVLPTSLADDADRRARFEREAQAVAALSHPNIVAIFDTGVHDGQLYVVMELLVGQTLRERLGTGSARGRNSDAAIVVPQLEQFIRDYPDYPDLDQGYTTLLNIVRKRTPERVNALADEFLVKFPGSRYRASVYDTRLTLLAAQKNESGVQSLGLAILQTETRPDVLDNAADYDTTHAFQLLDRAIAERRMNPNQSEAPTVLDLRWS